MSDYKQMKNTIAARIILLHSLNLTLWTLNGLLPTQRVNPRAQIVSHALKKKAVFCCDVTDARLRSEARGP